jgi:hypothetical protein
MKIFIRLFILVVVFSGIVACSTTFVSNKPLPPGQAKKVTGSQSAKPYAPGQKKKKN